MKNRNILLISFIVLVFDFISKIIVSNLMVVGDSIKVIDNFIYITYARNTGVAFSLLDNSLLFIIIITFVVIIGLIWYICKNKFDKYNSICYGLVIGGAIGNLIDRIIYGYVIDFIDIYIFGYDYPIFNMADIFIVVGIIGLFILSIREVGDNDGNKSNRK